MLGRIAARHVLAFMGLWGTFSTFLLKINLSVAIVDMIDFEETENYTRSQKNNLGWNDTLCEDQGAAADKNSTVSKSETKFIWSGSLQGLILGSFSYGAVSAVVAMAYASRRFGHVRVLGVSVLLSSATTILIPVLTEAGGYIALVLLRIIAGMFAGATATVLLGLVGKWCPPQERSKTVAIIFVGAPVGTSCVMPIAGLLAATLGWKSVFYVAGAFAASWALLWLALIHETPERHPRISQRERDFITNSLQNIKTERKGLTIQVIASFLQRPSVPWKKIFKSKVYWFLVTVHFTSVYGRATLSSMLPSYLKTVLRYNVQKVGLYSAIPFMGSGIFLFCTGPMADLIIARGVRTIVVRKAFTAAGMFSSGTAIIAAGYSGCNVTLAIFLFTVVIAMDSFSATGFKPCHTEIAPEYTGVLFGISASAAYATGIVAPQIAGSLRQVYGFLGWKIAFWIAGVLYFLGCAQFLIFGSNERQSWATPKNIRPSVATVGCVLDEENQ